MKVSGRGRFVIVMDWVTGYNVEVWYVQACLFVGGKKMRW